MATGRHQINERQIDTHTILLEYLLDRIFLIPPLPTSSYYSCIHMYKHTILELISCLIIRMAHLAARPSTHRLPHSLTWRTTNDDCWIVDVWLIFKFCSTNDHTYIHTYMHMQMCIKMCAWNVYMHVGYFIEVHRQIGNLFESSYTNTEKLPIYLICKCMYLYIWSNI